MKVGVDTEKFLLDLSKKNKVPLQLSVEAYTWVPWAKKHMTVDVLEGNFEDPAQDGWDWLFKGNPGRRLVEGNFRFRGNAIGNAAKILRRELKQQVLR